MVAICKFYLITEYHHDYFSFRIFVGTWNVNGQVAGECLKPWFKVDTDPPDIIAVG